MRRGVCLLLLMVTAAVFGQTNETGSAASITNAPTARSGADAESDFPELDMDIGPAGSSNTNAPDASIEALKELPLEELMNLEVTSVSKRPEKLSQAAAAIDVITQDDIRRSGALTIQEALRMATGYEVARIDAHRYAITARGFNEEFANKLLVLMDGRSIYTPLFGGVDWNQQGPMIQNIDRIEAIRGPGGTLWGANAMNGVINIISKDAKETQGTLLDAGGGAQDRWFGSARYGGKMGENAYYRVYGTAFQKYEGRDDDVTSWQHDQGGFRVDWQPSDPNHLTFQGDYYAGAGENKDFLPSSTPPLFFTIGENRSHFTGGNLLGHWTHDWNVESQGDLLWYYDNYSLAAIGGRETLNVGDVEYQHHLKIGERQDFTGGAGYRIMRDELLPGVLATSPDERTMQVFSCFLQDQITAVPDKLTVTVGSKFEHDEFAGFEAQPNLRLAWTPTPKQTVWSAISRAVRTPTRADHDNDSLFTTVFVGGKPVFLRAAGNPNFQSEKVVAYELGYRVQLHERVMFDLATFYNNYSDLENQVPTSLDATKVPPVQTLTLDNSLEGHSYGFELSGECRLLDWWTLRPSYTYLMLDVKTTSGVLNFIAATDEGTTPRNQFSLRSSMDLPHNVSLDFWVRYVGALSGGPVPSYTTADLRLAWRPMKKLELSIVGQDLFQQQHPEFNEPVFTPPGRPPQIDRGFYARVTWEF